MKRNYLIHSFRQPEVFLLTVLNGEALKKRLEGVGVLLQVEAVASPGGSDVVLEQTSDENVSVLSPTLHLQSVSGRHAAVTASPPLSITPGRDIIVLTQVDRGRSDDR